MKWFGLHLLIVWRIGWRDKACGGKMSDRATASTQETQSTDWIVAVAVGMENKEQI